MNNVGLEVDFWKILEPIALVGMVAFLGVMFLIFMVEHLLIRGPARFIKSKFKRRRRKRV